MLWSASRRTLTTVPAPHPPTSLSLSLSLSLALQIQRHVAESYAEYMAGRSYLYNYSRSMKLENAGTRLDSDGIKLFTTTMSKNVADRAIQVLGGYGYCGEYQVEQLWRDSKLLEIGGGTLESHHKNMVKDLRKMGNVL